MSTTERPTGPVLLAALILGCCTILGGGEAAAPAQIPLCMVGDSITWAMEGDCWREKMLKRLPRLAFVGTHSAKFGFSHAGEGGNNVQQVLARLADLPACPNYHLLIGTNNNSINDAALVAKTADATTASILAIVDGLLRKPGTRTVFVGSLLPCTDDNQAKPGNPLRAATNAATNQRLRSKLLKRFRADQVVWVEYEQPILAHPGWEKIIRLHPLPDGYDLLAEVLAKQLAATFAIRVPLAVPGRPPGSGVRVDNLLDPATATTRQPVVAGWYTLSFTVKTVTAPAQVVLAGAKSPFKTVFPLTSAEVGTRCEREVMTGYEGYGYTRDLLSVTATGAVISDLQLEKRRPSGRASIFGNGRFLDNVSPWSPGELLDVAP